MWRNVPSQRCGHLSMGLGRSATKVLGAGTFEAWQASTGCGAFKFRVRTRRLQSGVQIKQRGTPCKRSDMHAEGRFCCHQGCRPQERHWGIACGFLSLEISL